MLFRNLLWFLFTLKMKSKFLEWLQGFTSSAPFLSSYLFLLLHCYSWPRSLHFSFCSHFSLCETLQAQVLLGTWLLLFSPPGMFSSRQQSGFHLPQIFAQSSRHLVSEAFLDHIFHIALFIKCLLYLLIWSYGFSLSFCCYGTVFYDTSTEN